MDRPAPVIPIVMVVNACLWGFAMIMTSRALSGTGGYAAIQGILAACAGASLIVVGGGLAGVYRKLKQVE
jgi:hypothetical protein